MIMYVAAIRRYQDINKIGSEKFSEPTLPFFSLLNHRCAFEKATFAVTACEQVAICPQNALKFDLWSVLSTSVKKLVEFHLPNWAVSSVEVGECFKLYFQGIPCLLPFSLMCFQSSRIKDCFGDLLCCISRPENVQGERVLHPSSLLKWF